MNILQGVNETDSIYFCLQFYCFFINFVQHAEEKQLNNMPGDKYFS